MVNVPMQYALVKVLLASLLMVGAVRLFVLLFLGDAQREPAIGAMVRKVAVRRSRSLMAKSDTARSRRRP
jgi:hypothetical protein